MPQDMGGEREIRILSEPPHHIINAACGEASALLREEQSRFVPLRNQLLALFQLGVECRSHLSIQGYLPIAIALTHAHNDQSFARRQPHVVDGERCTFANA